LVGVAGRWVRIVVAAVGVGVATAAAAAAAAVDLVVDRRRELGL